MNLVVLPSFYHPAISHSFGKLFKVVPYFHRALRLSEAAVLIISQNYQVQPCNWFAKSSRKDKKERKKLAVKGSGVLCNCESVIIELKRHGETLVEKRREKKLLYNAVDDRIIAPF